ncbi:sigma-70 family RNA polymerase sigma factor [Actinokineospora cianjurensis]
MAAVLGDPRAIERVLAITRQFVVPYCRARIGSQNRTFASADDIAQEVCLAVLTALPGYRDQERPFLALIYGIAAHKVADAYRAANRDTPGTIDINAVHFAPDPDHQAVLADELRLLGHESDGSTRRLGESGVSELMARSSFGTRSAQAARTRGSRHNLDDRAAKLVTGVLRSHDSNAEDDAMRTDLPTRMGELLRMLPDKHREIVILRIVIGLSVEETAQAIGSTPGAVRVAQHRALARLRTFLGTEEESDARSSH